MGWWSGGAGVAQPGHLGGGEWVGQAAQQDTVRDDLHDPVVQADGDAAAGEVVADGVVAASQTDGADAVDGAVDLDRTAQLGQAGDDGGRAGWLAAVGQELAQVGGGSIGTARS